MLLNAKSPVFKFSCFPFQAHNNVMAIIICASIFSFYKEPHYSILTVDSNYLLWHFLSFSCPVDETTITIQSQKVGVDRFSTEAFKFIADHPFVFVHCQIRICDASNPGSRCAQGCIKEGRLRRDVSDEDKLYPLAQGPLTIASDATEMKSRKRSNKKGTCSSNKIINENVRSWRKWQSLI